MRLYFSNIKGSGLVGSEQFILLCGPKNTGETTILSDFYRLVVLLIENVEISFVI